nr:LPS export ABC transporter periplasmic protein LptC [Ancylothrix sp. D3o]
MELIGEVLAITKEEPILQLRTERVLWEIDKELVIAPQSLLIDRYEAQKISDKAESKQGEVNLKTKIVTLKENATVTLLDPTLQITSNAISWNLDAEMVTSSEPVKINQVEDKIIFTGNSGKVDIKQEICYLTGNVQGFDTVKQSQLRADELMWLLKTENIEAEGNVIYRQVDPEFTVSGPKATGSLKDQTVTVTGGGGPVVTEIVPQQQR